MRSATGFCVCFTSSASLSSSLLGCCGSAACVDSATNRKRMLDNKRMRRTFVMGIIHPPKIYLRFSCTIQRLSQVVNAKAREAPAVGRRHHTTSSERSECVSVMGRFHMLLAASNNYSLDYKKNQPLKVVG